MFEKIIKDYFSFSKKERIAVLILVFLLVVVFLLPHLFPKSEAVWKQSDLKKFELQAGQHQAKKDEQFTAGNDYKKFKMDGDAPFNETILSNKEKQSSKAAMFYFDPNELSGEGWKKFGLRDKTIATIQNYISKGGKFKKKEDIEKIYGLGVEDANRLMPYIRLENARAGPKRESYQVGYNVQSPQTYIAAKSHVPLRIIDINKADTTALIALPGIGSKLAARMVHFREKLGGFYTIDQVSEIYGLPDSTFQKIRPVLTITNDALQSININTVEVSTLKLHPYIKWNVAEAIIEYRKQHGSYKSLEDLRNIELITNELFNKITPYFKVE